ncbi:hypothetical protein D3C72_1239380 [compost metagenome]
MGQIAEMEPVGRIAAQVLSLDPAALHGGAVEQFGGARHIAGGVALGQPRLQRLPARGRADDVGAAPHHFHKDVPGIARAIHAEVDIQRAPARAQDMRGAVHVFGQVALGAKRARHVTRGGRAVAIAHA